MIWYLAGSALAGLVAVAVVPALELMAVDAWRHWRAGGR